jgi:hypothetical protein
MKKSPKETSEAAALKLTLQAHLALEKTAEVVPGVPLDPIPSLQVPMDFAGFVAEDSSKRE